MWNIFVNTDWKKAGPMLAVIIVTFGGLFGAQISQGDSLAYANLATGVLSLVATFYNTRKNGQDQNKGL